MDGTYVEHTDGAYGTEHALEHTSGTYGEQMGWNKWDGTCGGTHMGGILV